jgi:GNAT superfamily N-acetyltransferase
VNTWTITSAPAPATLDHPDAWAVRGAAAVSHAADLALWGHTDTALSARYLLSRLHEQTYARRTYLVATAGDRVGDADGVVGLAMVVMPTTGNDHAAFVEVLVHPEHRRRGAGRALLAEGQRLAREAGRATVISSTEHRGEPAAGEVGVLVPPTGSGRIRASDPGAVFAATHGFRLGQAERYSVLELPAEADRVGHLHAEAAARAGTGYRTVRWRDRVPDELLDEFAVLETRMTTDAPNGEIDFREEVWTAERVRAYEQQIAAANHGSLVVAVQHVATGNLVGFTMVEYVLDEDEPVFQEDTIVLGEHRGHHLGMLIKSELVRWLATERPGARRVHTWNAEENGHMLAINVALGFRPAGVAGMWQTSLT